MIKDDNTVIEFVSPVCICSIILDNDDISREFNSLVNMSAPELREWLEGDVSQASGWHKSDSSDTETVGHERFVFSSSYSIQILLMNTD